VYRNLGTALYCCRNYAEAAHVFREATRRYGGSVRFRYELAAALYEEGRVQEAQQLYREALGRDPAWPGAAHQMVRQRIKKGNLDAWEQGAGIFLTKQACQATGHRQPDFTSTLAAAYAAAGRYADAIVTAREALAAASASGRGDLVREIEEQLREYQRLKTEMETPTPVPENPKSLQGPAS
jgi:spermidine synthase